MKLLFLIFAALISADIIGHCEAVDDTQISATANVKSSSDSGKTTVGEAFNYYRIYYENGQQFNPYYLSGAYFNLAQSYSTQGNYPKALEYLEKSLGFNPNNVDVYVGLAQIYSTQGNYPKALECLQKALGLNPNSADYYSRVAEI
jgi:tetratricopeptide (TPR) repeat protein